MTGPELSAALRTLGWPLRELARRLGCSENIVRRMVAGKRKIEPDLAHRLQRAAEAVQRLLPPAPCDDTPKTPDPPVASSVARMPHRPLLYYAAARDKLAWLEAELAALDRTAFANLRMTMNLRKENDESMTEFVRRTEGP